MTLDPVIALSVASAMVAFIKFGVTLLKRAYVIYSSPDRADAVHLEPRKLTSIILALNVKLKRSLKTSTGCLTRDK